MDQFTLSLIFGLFLGAAAAYLGSLMVIKRMALVTDALGHVALPGIGLALLWQLDISLGALATLLLGVLLIWFLEIKIDLPTEAIVGVIFVSSLAIGLLLIPQDNLLEALAGDISGVTFGDTLTAVILGSLIFILISRIYPKQILNLIFGHFSKKNVIFANLVYLLAVAVITAMGIKMVGSLLVGALTIIPAATAKNLSQTLRQYTWGSVSLGVISSLLGLLFFKFFAWPAGPAIILTNTIFFLLSLFFKRKTFAD